MSDNKHADNDPERTLVTLEQLSQTIEVMTNVVNRLRQHLSEQLQAQVAKQTQAGSAASAPATDSKTAEHAPTRDEVVQAQQQTQQTQQQRESFVVEIRQQESEPVRKNNKTLH